jgi:hypothetical protein
MDPDPAIFIIDLQDANKKLIFLEKSFSAYYFLKVHFHHFSKLKSQKEVTRQYKTRFFLLFLHNDRRIRIRIHSSDKWIRIQEAQKHVDPESDPIRNTAYNKFARCSEPASLHGSGAGSGHQHHGTNGESETFLPLSYLSLTPFLSPFPSVVSNRW